MNDRTRRRECRHRHRPRAAGSPGIARALLLGAFAAALAACSKPPAMPAFERPPAPVQVATAVVRDVPVYLDQIGRVVATETVWVQAQVDGRVAEVHFADGADLKKGDLLFTVDARRFQARLDAAEAAVLRARAGVLRAEATVLRPQAALARATAARDLARQELARARSLVESKAVSQSDFDAKKSAVDMADAEVQMAEADVRQVAPEVEEARAAVQVAEAEVAMARLDVEYCTIRSAIDGRAGHRLVDAGNLVRENESKLVMIERLDPVYVEFTVDENDVAAVQRNMARGALRVEARLPDDPGEARAGELTFLDNTVQAAAGTLRLRATLQNADHRFWPGRFVKVRLVLETLPGAALVPVGAPQLSGKGTYVYVVKDDGTAEMRIVTLGQSQGDLVVVTDGVEAGERVVTLGQLAVTPGGKVRIEEVGAAAGAPAAGTAPASGSAAPAGAKR